MTRTAGKNSLNLMYVPTQKTPLTDALMLMGSDELTHQTLLTDGSMPLHLAVWTQKIPLTDGSMLMGFDVWTHQMHWTGELRALPTDVLRPKYHLTVALMLCSHYNYRWLYYD